MHPGCILLPITMPHLSQGIDRNIFLLHIMPSPVIDRIPESEAVYCRILSDDILPEDSPAAHDARSGHPAPAPSDSD